MEPNSYENEDYRRQWASHIPASLVMVKVVAILAVWLPFHDNYTTSLFKKQAVKGAFFTRGVLSTKCFSDLRGRETKRVFHRGCFCSSSCWYEQAREVCQYFVCPASHTQWHTLFVRQTWYDIRTIVNKDPPGEEGDPYLKPQISIFQLQSELKILYDW